MLLWAARPHTQAQSTTPFHVNDQTHIQYTTNLTTVHSFFYPSMSHHTSTLPSSSALSNLRISSTFIAQVSLPYTITLYTCSINFSFHLQRSHSQGHNG